MRRVLLVVVFVLVGAVPAFAQSNVAVNPSTVCFAPSPDHDRIALDGTTPVVTRYELRLFQAGAAQPFTTQDVGKPAPVNNEICVTNRSWFIPAANGVKCLARIAAISPYGEAVSPDSNPFGNEAGAKPTGAPVIR